MGKRVVVAAAGSRLEGFLGGYAPLRRVYRRLRPRWMAGLSPAGREILRFVPQHGLVVTAGPFRGMRYPGRAVGHVSFLAAKVLGSYERELRGCVEALIELDPHTVVNVGAGDGYYAVGFAMRLANASVYAFDLDGGERSMCRRLAGENGVGDKVHIKGFCDHEQLAPLARPGAVLVVDCEGYEGVLLDLDAVPSLRACSMLIELHPAARPGVIEEIEDRFAATHTFRLICGEDRDPAEYSELDGLDSTATFLLLSEGWLEGDAGAGARRWGMLAPMVGAVSR